MAADPFGDPGADLQAVLEALDDPDCRTIVEHLEEPMTASEIADATGIPLSTTYRKLDRLTEATIVEEHTEIRSDGHHATLYRCNFESVEVTLEDGQSFAVDISRPTTSPDERLAGIWSEVQKET